jgi:two-component system, NtrC family, nitrogen regulation response regulator GlnG
MSTVLVVDDDGAVLKLVCDAFELAGHETVAMDHGAAALRYLATAAPDLVVTDWRMRGLSGDHVVGAARELYPALPIIVITGDPGQTDGLIDPDDSRLRVVAKPFVLATLVEDAERLIA